MESQEQKRAALRFIDPEILSRISSLELLARHVVEGFIAGLHKSPYKGFSVEFMEYRPYIQGDDPKRIDWKLYGRTDRLYVKEFEEETNTTCHILADISNSMAYTSSRVTKLHYGFFLAASLAYFMIRQRDSVGLYLFDDKIVDRIPPKSSRGHLHTILNKLENTDLGMKTAMGKPFHDIADSIKKRGIVVIISDLLDDADDIINGLKHFCFDGNDLILFHILDPFETAYKFKDLVELEDMETGEKILLMPEAAREIYIYNLERFRNTLKKNCGLLGVDYLPITTDQPLDFALFQYLAGRSRRE